MLSLAQTLSTEKYHQGSQKDKKINFFCPILSQNVRTTYDETNPIPFVNIVTRVHEKNSVHQPPDPASRWEYAFGQKLTRVFLKLEPMRTGMITGGWIHEALLLKSLVLFLNNSLLLE